MLFEFAGAHSGEQVGVDEEGPSEAEGDAAVVVEIGCFGGRMHVQLRPGPASLVISAQGDKMVETIKFLRDDGFIKSRGE